MNDKIYMVMRTLVPLQRGDIQVLRNTKTKTYHSIPKPSQHMFTECLKQTEVFKTILLVGIDHLSTINQQGSDCIFNKKAFSPSFYLSNGT